MNLEDNMDTEFDSMSDAGVLERDSIQELENSSQDGIPRRHSFSDLQASDTRDRSFSASDLVSSKFSNTRQLFDENAAKFTPRGVFPTRLQNPKEMKNPTAPTFNKTDISLKTWSKESESETQASSKHKVTLSSSAKAPLPSFGQQNLKEMKNSTAPTFNRTDKSLKTWSKESDPETQTSLKHKVTLSSSAKSSMPSFSHLPPRPTKKDTKLNSQSKIRADVTSKTYKYSKKKRIQNDSDQNSETQEDMSSVPDDESMYSNNSTYVQEETQISEQANATTPSDQNLITDCITIDSEITQKPVDCIVTENLPSESEQNNHSEYFLNPLPIYNKNNNLRKGRSDIKEDSNKALLHGTCFYSSIQFSCASQIDDKDILVTPIVPLCDDSKNNATGSPLVYVEEQTVKSISSSTSVDNVESTSVTDKRPTNQEISSEFESTTELEGHTQMNDTAHTEELDSGSSLGCSTEVPVTITEQPEKDDSSVAECADKALPSKSNAEDEKVRLEDDTFDDSEKISEHLEHDTNDGDNNVENTVESAKENVTDEDDNNDVEHSADIESNAEDEKVRLGVDKCDDTDKTSEHSGNNTNDKGNGVENTIEFANENLTGENDTGDVECSAILEDSTKNDGAPDQNNLIFDDGPPQNQETNVSLETLGNDDCDTKQEQEPNGLGELDLIDSIDNARSQSETCCVDGGFETTTNTVDGENKNEKENPNSITENVDDTQVTVETKTISSVMKKDDEELGFDTNIDRSPDKPMAATEEPKEDDASVEICKVDVPETIEDAITSEENLIEPVAVTEEPKEDDASAEKCTIDIQEPIEDAITSEENLIEPVAVTEEPKEDDASAEKCTIDIQEPIEDAITSEENLLEEPMTVAEEPKEDDASAEKCTVDTQEPIEDVVTSEENLLEAHMAATEEQEEDDVNTGECAVESVPTESNVEEDGGILRNDEIDDGDKISEHSEHDTTISSSEVIDMKADSHTNENINVVLPDNSDDDDDDDNSSPEKSSASDTKIEEFKTDNCETDEPISCLLPVAIDSKDDEVIILTDNDDTLSLHSRCDEDKVPADLPSSSQRDEEKYIAGFDRVSVIVEPEIVEQNTEEKILCQSNSENESKLAEDEEILKISCLPEDRTDNFVEDEKKMCSEQLYESDCVKDKGEFDVPQCDENSLKLDDSSESFGNDESNEDISPMEKWNRDWQKTIRDRKNAENDAMAELVKSAQIHMDEFKREKEASKLSRVERNAQVENEMLEEMERQLEGDNPWKRVYSLVDFSSEGVGDDSSRMKDILTWLESSSHTDLNSVTEM